MSARRLVGIPAFPAALIIRAPAVLDVLDAVDESLLEEEAGAGCGRDADEEAGAEGGAFSNGLFATSDRGRFLEAYGLCITLDFGSISLTK